MTMAHEPLIELHAFAHHEPGLGIARDDDAQPRRPKASPRPTPSPSSGRHTPDPLEDSDSDDQRSSSGRLKSPIRGRTRPIVGSGMRGLPPLAIPRRRAGPSSIDFDDHRVFSHRIMSKDLSSSPDELDSSILESYPTGTVNLNVAEILSEADSSTLQSPASWSGFAGHRDTFALLQMHGGNTGPFKPDLPPTFFQRLERYIDFGTYLSIRLSCRCWSAAISSVRPPRFATTASSLPVEIVQRICALLSPIDFNAARHLCRAWMLASLSQKLLVHMLQCGGWWSAARADMALIEEWAPGRIPSGEWLLSKRLSTECSLRPDWTGNGLGDEVQDGSTSSLPKPSLDLSNGRRAFESFMLDSEIDFSALSPDGHGAGEGLQASSSRFTISDCGKYLLVARDCTIYIYGPNSHASIAHHAQSPSPVQRLTSLVCPHRVLAVSMDISSDRFAVAALLQGRTGFVCDLRELGTLSHRSTQGAYQWDTVFSALWERQDSATNSADLGDKYDSRFSSSTPRTTEALSWRKSSDYSNDPPTPPYPSANQMNMPVVPGLSSVFHNLGSAIDLPLSVAICPQRRCLAFGYSTAVELHWVDALTGQGLSRRFSIPAGGEIVHFFPARKDEKRMRVIGSGVVPDVWRGVGKEGHLEPDDEGEMSRDDPSAPERSDYYNAIPLSDGTHVLFVNRVSAELCLGIETQPRSTAIDAGYMRLETLAILEGPLRDRESARTVPRIYGTARDLRWGVRIVVGFGDEVFVFAVPGDALKERAGECANENVEGVGDDDDGEAKTSVLRFSGIRVGEVEGLARVGICADGGGVLVRGTGRAGLFKEWRLTSRPGNVKRWVVRSDGSVVAQDEFDGSHSGAVELDADGDVVMRDYMRPNSSSCYDGEATGVESAYYDDIDEDDDEGGGGVAIEFDLDGDVIMRDVDMCYGGGVGGGEEELDEGYFSDEPGRGSGTLAIHPADAGDQGKSERMELGMGRSIDKEEDLWESSRVEVEVFGGCKGERER